MAHSLVAPASARDTARMRGLAVIDRSDAIVPASRSPRPETIRVAVADGQALVRAGLLALFESEDDIAVVAQAADGKRAVALSEEADPDVVLIDIGVSELDAVEVTRLICADGATSSPAVVILAAQIDDERLFAALRAGARGFLLKDSDPAELVRAVRVVATGDALLSPSIARRLITEIAAQPDRNRATPEQLEDLTAREREVVTLVAAGLSNQEIAEQLVVSPATAKTHVSRALYKVHARDRAQLVALAYETGLVTPRHARVVNAGDESPRLALAAA